MKNKILVVLIAIFSIFILTSCVDKNSDAYKFKVEYESLNNTKINDQKVRNIKIDKNNPFIYKSAGDIIKMMDNKESFVVYFGFNKCPWCRSVVPTLIDVAKDQELDTIYYVDVLDIRDTLKIDEKGNVVTDKKGTDDYYKLLTYLNDVLDDYNLTDEENKKIETNEKRIYAPNVVSVVNGKATKMTTGISKKQTDPYMKLTDEMIKETYNDFKCVIKCVTENKTVCTKQKQC
ncbi:MAG: hypothetical protein IJ105_05005 [Bacilli bacterium]|nr:hypothetical protein [Bacilli bacterium]